MKLRTKLFHITDSKGNDIDPNDFNIILILNGKPTETKLSDVFGALELDENEIYGNSLLSYYEVKDGKLVVEGSTIELAIDGTEERILINKITRPGVNDDTIIPYEHVQKFAEFFKVAKPEEVFIDLNEDEKQAFIHERLTAANIAAAARKAAEEADAEKENIAKEKEAADIAAAAKKAEAELKAGIDPKFIQNKKDYLSTQAFYRGENFKEYIDGPYHLFYGKSDEEAPFVLIKRGADWWEEPADTQIADETEDKITIEFTDGKVMKHITLDIASDKTTITDSEPSE